jgi:hypothetical protein
MPPSFPTTTRTLSKIESLVYVEGFTAAYTLLYIYFATSHCKNGDPKKDRDFQGWTFILAILSNALIMVSRVLYGYI